MNSAPDRSQSFFLSYSRSDESFALRFATDVRERGIPMWVDQMDIRPSEHWDRAIERAVHDCRGLVVLLSPRSVESDNVADEISFALEHGKSVLPVMIERCRLPLRITRMQVIDAVGGYAHALDQCVAALRGHPLNEDRNSSTSHADVFDAEVVATAKARLTDILGPIAPILVSREAARATTLAELYRYLGEHIDSKVDRERFISLAGAPAADSPSSPAKGPGSKAQEPHVSKAEVDRLGLLLTNYLGPISSTLARRESASASSADELQRRLAELIPNERERAHFLMRAQAGQD